MKGSRSALWMRDTCWALPAWRCGWRRAAWRRRSSSPGTLATSTSRSSGTLPGSMELTMWSWRAPTATGIMHRWRPIQRSLAKIIDDTFAKGGNVIIPSFAVGRTQELLYFMREMKKEGLVKSNPDFTVCVDSPLANEATKIFSGDLRGYLDEEALEVREGRGAHCSPSPAS
ncbi:MAG: hypothetical protein ACLT9P_07220 [Evtepia gabavorous]